ncbi:hypothetical protein ACQPZQ_04715 [Pseudonocardia sp. CA-142604]|uniref:hypothetical protein n=1 Tax=Pseudonocardia sp. CA-142604 TaxID=3240024 RepID=UPI003D8A74DC
MSPVEPLVAEPFLIQGSGSAPVVPVVMAVPAQDPAPPPGKGPEFGEASPVALVVIVLLAIVTIFLIRSMTKRLKRLPPSFGPAEDEPDKAGDEPGAPADDEAEAGKDDDKATLAANGEKSGTERGAGEAERRPEDAGGSRA